ncbi:MAG: right-handed parallel beta-helix repeat-containing protein [Armatimonadota bacterium]|nr:right-handed parallel beta-helix repeat-containing protein [Armatimonadota bacterium]
MRASVTLPAITLMLVMIAYPGRGQVVSVDDSQGLRQAVRSAGPGTTIMLRSGIYEGGIYLQNVEGAPDQPIIIAGEDPENPPVIAGGGSGMQLSEAAHVELRDLVLRGATGNGLNIDDGGSFETPTHHVILRRLMVMEVGPEGNRDGIKLSGVDDFLVEECTVQDWGSGGSAIDMVGCHRGLIRRCVLRDQPGDASNGVQAKGGSRDVIVRGNRFMEAGARAVNIGGSTGLRYFRPEPEGYEARDIVVEGNIFLGSNAPVAFVGVDGATVRFNTIYHPHRWALRILQETREPGFVASRNGVFTDNVIVFTSDGWSEGGVNIGPHTAPETFTFARNVWYCEDRPDRSAPALPTAERDAIVGEDPMLVAPDEGDFSLQEGSPAEGRGHTALPQEDEPAAQR